MRKHILNLLVFTLFGISSVMAQFSGSGTLSDPYIIASDQDLQNLATAVNAGNDFAGNFFKQTDDINLIESQLFPDGFTTIGGFDGSRQFSGTYDGDGHSISKMSISGSGKVAMFAKVQNGCIKNLSLENVNFMAEGESICAGLVAIASNSEISNVTVSGQITSSGQTNSLFLSGIAGQASRTSISGSLSLVTFDVENVQSALALIAGIAMGDTRTTVTNCFASTFIRGDYASYYPLIDVGTASKCLVAESNGTPTSSNVTYSGCYFDHQNTLIADYPAPQTDIAGFMPKATDALTTGSLFSNANWTESAGLYPRPAAIANTNAAILAASPMTLNSSDCINSVVSNFAVSTVNGVAWGTESNHLQILGTNVTLQSHPDSIVEIYAYRSNLVKNLQLKLAGGELGSKGNPYRISSEGDLFALANMLYANEAVNPDGEMHKSASDFNFDPDYEGELYFLLDNDITITSDSTWYPIGSSEKPFRWNFDGGNHVIDFSNCELSYSGGDYGIGCFGNTEGATISNLIVIYNNSASCADFGGIVALATSSVIYNCKAVGSINASPWENSGNVGGIVGYASNSTISNCTNFASILIESMDAGGIVGFSEGSNIRSCTNLGDFSGQTSYSGGIVGQTFINSDSGNAPTYIIGCANYGSMNFVSYVGPTIGKAINEYNSGAIVGLADAAIISDCANYGNGIIPFAGISQNSTYTNNINIPGNASVEDLDNEIGVLISSGSTNAANDKTYNTCDNNYTDKQMVPFAGYLLGFNQVPTADLISGNVELEAGKWIFNNGRYPVPAGTEYDNDWVKLATTPILFDANDNVWSICSEFTLDADNGISWMIDSVPVSSNSVNPDTWRLDSENVYKIITSYIGDTEYPHYIITPSRAGSADNPLLIESLEDFNNFAAAISDTTITYKGVTLSNNGEGRYFKLTTDLQAQQNSTNVVHVSQISLFKGNFNGGGHTITVTSNDITSPGLFTSIYYAQIDSLNILIDEEYEDDTEGYTGILSNSAQSSIISNCTVTANAEISVNAAICGVLQNSIVSGCSTYGTGKISRQYTNLAGIVTAANNSKIINCTNNLDVESEYGSDIVLAGIVAEAYSLVLENCVNNADIRSTSSENYLAGIVGKLTEEGANSTNKITNSVNNGDIYSVSYSGGAKIGNAAGIVGESSDATVTIERCVNAGNVTGGVNSSGIAGNINGKIENCANYGSLNSETNLYGISGGNSESSCAGNIVACMVTSSFNSGNDERSVISPEADAEDNFFDEQITELKVDSLRLNFYERGTARTTQSMVGSALANELPGEWDFTDGLYPLPTGLDPNDPRNKLARLPIILKSERQGHGERITSVISNFTLPQIDGVTWESSDPDIVLVSPEGGVATVTNSTEVTTVIITASCEGITREYMFNIHELQGISADNPYIINDCNELIHIANNNNYANGGYGLFFKLNNSIVINKGSITVDGNEVDGNFQFGLSTIDNPYVLFPANYPFRGTFDGNGHTITWQNTGYTGTYYGLFKYTDGATISNLSFYYNESGSYNYSGTLVGNAKATTINNCSVFSNLSATDRAGGIVDVATDGTVISGCVFAGELSAKNIGGIVADAEDTRIDNSVSMLRIRNTSDNPLETACAIVNLAKNNVEVDSCLVIGDNYDENINTIGLGEMSASNCYYDNQMWLVGESDSTTNNIIGKPTREIIGDGLFANSAKWAHVEGKYPVPAGTQNQAVGRLASIPLLINENDADIMHVTSITPYEADSISWSPLAFETEGPISNDFVVQCVDSETETAIMLSVDDATIGSLSFQRKLKVTKGIVEVDAPLDDFQPCEGGEISYSVAAGDATYLWTIEPEMEASAFDQDSITLYVPTNFMSAHTDNNSATLNLTVSYDACEKDFNFQFNVLPSPTHFSITNDTALCSGSDLTLKCTIDSAYEMYSDMFMLTWYDATDMQTPLQSDTAKTFYIPTLNADRTIKVVVDNGGMCAADTLEVSLTINPASEITVVSGEPNQQICEGEAIEPIVFSVTDPIYTFPYGIYAEYDTANNLLTFTGYPHNSENEAYTISACGNVFNGLIDVTYRSEGISNQSQVVNLGEEVNMSFWGAYNLENIITWESLDGSETFTTDELGLEVSSRQDEDGISSYIRGTAEMPGEYIFHLTIPAYENCPSITYDNFLGVYDNSALETTALDNAICLGETTTIATIERPGAYGGEYVWTIGNDTIGYGDRIDVTPQQTTTYNVLCGGKRMVGEFEIGDYVYWDDNLSENGYSMQKYYEYNSYQNETGYLIVNIEGDSLLLMTLARTENVIWAQAPEMLASVDADLYLPSVDEFGYLLNNYERFYRMFSENNIRTAILTSTIKDDNMVYAFNPNYGLIMEHPKAEPALAMGFKKIAKGEVVNMVGRTSNITRTGSINIIVSEHKSVEISTSDLLCNTDTAHVAIVTEYPTVNWYNISNPDLQVAVADGSAVLTDGSYIAVGTDEYGSCLDTVDVKVRNLAFDMPQDTTACDSVSITIAKENITVMLNDETIDGQTVVITESGTYTVGVFDPENTDCVEEKQINVTINHSYAEDINVTITDAEVYEWNGDTLSTTGIYTYNGQTANGCDSTLVLHLTVIDVNLSFVVSGSVVGVDGIPLEYVEVSNGSNNTQTDIDGLFSLTVARNNPVVKFVMDGYNIVYMDVEDNGEELLVVMEKPEMELQSGDLQVSTFPYVSNEIEVEITNNGDGPLTWSSVVVSDNINIVPSKSTHATRSMWDVVNAGFSTHSRAEQAVATDGFFIYTASWMRKGEFNRYTLDGYVETFNIHGVGAIRNLTYDGNHYFYATDNSNIIYKIDMGAQTVDSIVLPEGMEVRYCAYESDNVLYVGNWTSLYMVVLGQTITTIPMTSNLTNVYGVVYDRYHEGGPCLWAFSQISQNNGPAALIQMLDSDGQLTDVTHYVNDTIVNLLSTSTAGGICVSELLYDDKYVMLANVQNSTENNKIVIYEIGKKDVWLSLSQKSGVIPAGESVTVRVSELVRDEGNYSASIKFMPAVYNPNDISLSLSTQVSAPQCSAVTNFVAETDTFHVVNMTWDAAEIGDYESVAYLVYEASSFMPIDTVYGTSYTINGPTVGEHCYHVRAFMRGITDCVSAASESACIEIQSLPCNNPLIASVRPYADVINIAWNRLGGVEYYDIYRDDELLFGGLTGVAYTDSTAIPETEYCYKVVANFIGDACEPITSDQICSKIVANICNEVPVLTVEVLGNVTMLKWTKVADAQFYSLYRDGMYVTSTSDSLFFDVNLEYETEYCYTIEIACNYGIYNLSETVCATTGEAPEGNGIDQITADDIDVYPNPASGMFYVAGAEIKSVTMANSMGQVIYSTDDLNSDSVAINAEGIPAGVYALMIELDSGEIIMKRIVVR